MIILCRRFIIFGLLLLIAVPTNAVPAELPVDEQDQTTTPQTATSTPAQPPSTNGLKSLEGSKTIIHSSNVYGEQEGKLMKRKTCKNPDVRKVERLCKYVQEFLTCVQQGLPDCEQRLNAAIKCEEEKDQIKRLKRSHSHAPCQAICPNQLFGGHSYENAEPILVSGVELRPLYSNPPPEGVILCVPNEPYPAQQDASLPGIPMPVCFQPSVSPACGLVQELQPREPALSSEWGPNFPQFVPQFGMIPGSSNPSAQGGAKQRYLSQDIILSSHRDGSGWRYMNQPWMFEENPAEAQRILLH